MLSGQDHIRTYVNLFNGLDEERVTQAISNAEACEWMENNIPLLDCPDKELERIYYFRWWTFRKHIKKTADGYIITEFHPDVPWAGKHNSIVCPAGHHIYEGRWLRNTNYLTDYIRFWFHKGGDLRSYSTWLVDAAWQFCKITGLHSFAAELLPDFVEHYRAWEESHQHESGLFWSIDDRDGGEHSISGNGLRPTLNSYLYADARAIAEIAELAGQQSLSDTFHHKADSLKQLIHQHLWDEQDQFFKVFPLDDKNQAVSHWEFSQVSPDNNVRELHGYIPWHFGLANEEHHLAWRQINDGNGFYAPYGLTTAEQRHTRFMFELPSHQCLWNGPSWPFTTSFALSGMARALKEDLCPEITPDDYLQQLKIYTRAHQHTKANGQTVPWIDENLDPFSGEWRARQILESWGWPAHKGGKERGKDYNHSTYCDLIINGLIGLDIKQDKELELHPMIPEEQWDYFCLDRVIMAGREVTVVYDRTGDHYGRQKGLSLYIDGELKAQSDRLTRLTLSL